MKSFLGARAGEGLRRDIARAKGIDAVPGEAEGEEDEEEKEGGGGRRHDSALE
jgi:hypothetical protein